MVNSPFVNGICVGVIGFIIAQHWWPTTTPETESSHNHSNVEIEQVTYSDSTRCQDCHIQPTSSKSSDLYGPTFNITQTHNFHRTSEVVVTNQSRIIF